MSDYHVLSQQLYGATESVAGVRVLFHIPVPANGTNETGISWQAAVVRAQGGAEAIASLLFDIAPAELDELKAGARVEYIEQIFYPVLNPSPAEIRNAIEVRFNALRSELIAKKQKELAWIGYEANVA